MENLTIAVLVLGWLLSLELFLLERRIKRLESLPSIKDFLKQAKSKKRKK